jgi:DNA (cytosine-5)-methyltransferase 1
VLILSIFQESIFRSLNEIRAGEIEMTRNAIDLFAGCGGLTCGLKQAGFDVLAAVEMWPSAAEAYRLNHKSVDLRETEIEKLDPTLLMASLKLTAGDLDLLAGCPPCQGFSTVRTLNGKRIIKDDRNDLVHEMVKFVKIFLPKVVLLENVPGLAEDARISTIEAELEELNYTVSKALIDVADYGVPQRRKRFILTAGKFGQVHSPEPSEKRRTVRQAIEGMKSSGTSGDAIHDFPENRTELVKRRILKIPKNGGSRCDLPPPLQLECHKTCTGFKDIYGRMAWDEVAPTLTTGCFNPSKGRFLHPEQNRAITMREASLLQSFPSDYIFPSKFGKAVIATMIGNAIPPIFVQRQAEAICRYLDEAAAKPVRRKTRA